MWLMDWMGQARKSKESWVTPRCLTVYWNVKQEGRQGHGVTQAPFGLLGRGRCWTSKWRCQEGRCTFLRVWRDALGNYWWCFKATGLEPVWSWGAKRRRCLRRKRWLEKSNFKTHQCYWIPTRCSCVLIAGSEPDLSLARGVKDKPPSNQDVLLGTERELESPRGTADHVLPMVTHNLLGSPGTLGELLLMAKRSHRRLWMG